MWRDLAALYVWEVLISFLYLLSFFFFYYYCRFCFLAMFFHPDIYTIIIFRAVIAKEVYLPAMELANNLEGFNL